MNYLNVCTPSDAETKEIASALARIPAHPHFAPDFEVSRGLSRMSDDLLAAGAGAQMKSTYAPPTARWVRVRKEFPDQAPFLNAQYSFSVTNDQVSETLVFRARDARELMQVSLSDSAISADPNTIAKSNTAADRIRIERFGKSSLVLARCPSGDQTKYESLFQTASSLLTTYRKALNVRTIVVTDLAKIPTK